jgi:hypothetical protein
MLVAAYCAVLALLAVSTGVAATTARKRNTGSNKEVCSCSGLVHQQAPC